MAAFIQLFMRYGFTLPFGMEPALDHWQFSGGVLATMLLMAAGYIINDIYDIETDRINKPDKVIIGVRLSEKNAWKIYFFMNLIGLLISIYLCLVIDRIKYFTIPFITVVLLYLYAIDLKRRPLIGNLVISLLASMSVLTVLFFDIMPVIYLSSISVNLRYFILVVYVFIAVFAFLTTLTRELLKTLEDVRGDLDAGFNTIAISLGNKFTEIFTLFVLMILVSFTVFSAVKIHSFPLYMYILIFLLIPWMTAAYFILSKSKKNYTIAQKCIKITMVSGILSLLVIQV